MSVLYAPLGWRRWNNRRIQNRLARFLFLLTLHTTNAIVATDAAADNNNSSSSPDILDVMAQTLTSRCRHALTDS